MKSLTLSLLEFILENFSDGKNEYREKLFPLPANLEYWFSSCQAEKVTKIKICDYFMKYVKEHPNLPWSWQGLSRNPNLTMKFVEHHLNLPWDWSKMSYNLNCNYEIYRKTS